MSINKEKTRCMLFNKAQNYNIMPELCMSDITQLEVVERMKLVGCEIRLDPNTKSNTKYIVGTALNRMWIIRRLKVLGACEAVSSVY